MISPAFQFYPKDWLTDIKVILMNPTQRGGYIQLLCHMWLSDDLRLPIISLPQLSGVSGEDLNTVINCFTILDENYITHKRLIEEMEKQKENKVRRSAAGRKGMKSRYSRPRKAPNNVITGVQDSVITKSNSSSSIASSTAVINTSKEVLGDTPKKAMEDFISLVESNGTEFTQFCEKVSSTKGIDIEIVRAELAKFVNHWAEQTKDGRKQRWQLEETFEVQRRLGKWFSNAEQWGTLGSKKSDSLTSV